MHLTFHLRQPFRKALALAAAMQCGAARHGDQIDIECGFEQVRDGGLVLFGIGGMAREIYDAYRSVNRQVIFWDKGYSRGEWFRVAVNDFQPLAYFQHPSRPPDRLGQLGLNPIPYDVRGDAILVDGASNKYCLWHGLGDWIEWGRGIVRRIRRHSDRPIIYRPRPSHNVTEPISIKGAEFSQAPLMDDLARSALVVSHGGNIGFDCALGGVAHFAIGDSIARPISETVWQSVGRPFIPTERARCQWLCDVAYCQWRIGEIESGQAWEEIRHELRASLQ